MDELMLMNYLKSKGMGNMSEQEFIHKFREFMDKNKGTSYMKYHNTPEEWEYENDMYIDKDSKRNQLGYYDMYVGYPEYAMYSEKMGKRPLRGINRMNNSWEDSMYENYIQEDHFDMSRAKYIVNSMYHITKGKKSIGEIYSMHKAHEVLEKYKHSIPSEVTVADVYVAINAQYHDYSELFLSWFGENIDCKIIESAVTFWFKDTDYKKGFKLGNYFKE
jgi:hypothetical protein